MSIKLLLLFFFFFKQKTAYEMRISDWSSAVCSSDLDPNHQSLPGRSIAGYRADLDLHGCRDDAGWLPAGSGQEVQGADLADRPRLQPGDGCPAVCQVRAWLSRRWRIRECADRSPHLRSGKEIGRASWRERGCQYG